MRVCAAAFFVVIYVLVLFLRVLSFTRFFFRFDIALFERHKSKHEAGVCLLSNGSRAART
jgi:hypothetical protein